MVMTMRATKMSVPLFLFTYNVGKKDLAEDDFEAKVAGVLPDDMPRLFVFGFQEMCLIMDGLFANVANVQLLNLNRIVLSVIEHKYGVAPRTLATNHVGAIGQILVTPTVLPFVTVRRAQVGCGYFGLSMKGAVGCRVTYKDKSQLLDLSFAVCHLAAGEGEHHYLKRNNNIHTILRSLDFGDGYGLLKPGAQAFVMGDLNYRTTKHFDAALPASQRLFELQDQAKSPLVAALVEEADELYKGKKQGDVFLGFSEPPISFTPSYKFVVGTAIYSRKRSPAWCDRIWYQDTHKRAQVKVHSYNKVAELLQSDHQPVYMHLTVPLDAPLPLVSAHGYLQVPQRRNEDVSGPTQMYMKPTRVDFWRQHVIRALVDSVLGYGLWALTTRLGRIRVFLTAVAMWGLVYLFR